MKERPEDSSKNIFEEKIANFKSHLLERGYPEDLVNTTLSKVHLKSENKPFNRNKEKPKNLAFCHTFPTISAYSKARKFSRETGIKYCRTTTITEGNSL